ncbi:hypothetical protein ONE63_001411 [Megalurothrips usitatus]|uniref:RING finger and SPRY domain-containing protein 1-like n=1 Tax=Megalurothrips usitatus TaxID=439358 RepID=A0AAV7XG76_9NEOP|nr:hypothetical protein ONE63_001411 [Megalurothrips usitatus]
MMGGCVCKDEDTTPLPNSASNGLIDDHYRPISHCGFKPASPGIQVDRVDELVLETLNVIDTYVETDQEPSPPSILTLHAIADQEDGWIQVVTSMIRVIPIHHPLGPAAITLLFDDCPLPTKECVLKLSNILNLSMPMYSQGTPQHRNTCVLLGLLAEKLSGPSSIAILTDTTLNYLINNLDPNAEPPVILFSLIALEKFAQTTENKVTIIKQLESMETHPILLLEKWVDSDCYFKRQVGFCAQWCLDNIFIVKDRVFSYQCVNVEGINVMLNTKDVSEYLKISPDGLEARCDAYSFESVRCTFQVDSGVWFYETLIITPGVMQIGWATKDSSFLNHEGYGIGDDEYSLAYDGCRRLVWYKAHSQKQNRDVWKPGDILGSLLDMDKQEIVFYINGEPLPPCTEVFKTASTGFFAAASFMSYQQCRFNFGSQPFRYPPREREFKSFNCCAQLSPEDKVILPRHIFLQQLSKLSVREDSCTLCFDKKASVRLLPCHHRGFCSRCADQLHECPMCRAPIMMKVDMP